LKLCGRCHSWLHANPYLAKGLGWEVDPTVDPVDVAAWILTPHRVGPGWHLLVVEDDADGIRRHVVRPVEAVWTP
jgi:hypothetical protein